MYLEVLLAFMDRAGLGWQQTVKGTGLKKVNDAVYKGLKSQIWLLKETNVVQRLLISKEGGRAEAVPGSTGWALLNSGLGLRINPGARMQGV